MAYDRYKSPDNAGKSKESAYLSLIQYGESLIKIENREKAKKVSLQLEPDFLMLKSTFPGAAQEFEIFYYRLYARFLQDGNLITNSDLMKTLTPSKSDKKRLSNE